MGNRKNVVCVQLLDIHILKFNKLQLFTFKLIQLRFKLIYIKFQLN